MKVSEDYQQIHTQYNIMPRYKSKKRLEGKNRSGPMEGQWKADGRSLAGRGKVTESDRVRWPESGRARWKESGHERWSEISRARWKESGWERSRARRKATSHLLRKSLGGPRSRGEVLVKSWQSPGRFPARVSEESSSNSELLPPWRLEIEWSKSKDALSFIGKARVKALKKLLKSSFRQNLRIQDIRISQN